MNKFSKLILGVIMATALLLPMSTAVLANSSDSEDLAIVGISLFFWVCAFAISLIVNVTIAIWIYKDASARKDPNAILWLLIVIVSGFIGGIIIGLIILVLYLLFGRKDGGNEANQTPDQSN